MPLLQQAHAKAGIHKYTIEFDEETWRNLVQFAGRGNIKDYIIHLLRREFASVTVRAVILCGGQEREVAGTGIPVPKPMLPIHYRPVLEYTVHWLKEHGLSHLVLSTGGPHSELIKDYFLPRNIPGVEFEFTREETPLGTGGPVRVIQPQLKNTFIVINGDILTNANLSAMLDAHRRNKALGTIMLTPTGPQSPEESARFGTVSLKDDGTVTEYHEKEATHGQHINAGVYIFEPEIFPYLPQGGNFSMERDVFPRLVDRGLLRGWVMHKNDYWLDVTDPNDYARAWNDIMTGRLHIPGVNRTVPTTNGETATA